VYGYDPETKEQLSQWKNSSSSRPKKAQWVRSEVKVLLTVFFDYRGIVHHSYAPEGQTINKEYYLEVMHHLHDAVRRKRPDLWASRNWQLHHDNAPAHSLHLIQSFLTKHGIPVVRQAPYSPDMAPCDFWVFPKLKRPLKGSHFDSCKGIMRNVTKELRSLPEMLPAVEGTFG
jgi:transposase